MRTMEIIPLDLFVPTASNSPWLGEADCEAWRDSKTGYQCCISRGWSGALCGYVRVPMGHPAYRKKASHAVNRLQAHGGITFTGRPYSLTYRRTGWWVGFDCAHGDDYLPRRPELTGRVVGEYRDASYVRAQCSHLAEQLASHVKRGGA